MTELASRFTVLWASQTGNAEWIAKNIHSEAVERGYVGDCYPMDQYEKAELDKARVLIFVTSNTGDGDPPDHSLKFWRFLRRLKQPDYFKNCKIAVLGLGDTNYTNFNNTAKRLEKKAKELGATVFHEKGLADEAEGLESVVDPWIAKLWEALPRVLEKKGDDGVQEITEKMSTVQVEQDNNNPYALKDRSKKLPPPVEKYLDLPNTLVVGKEKPQLVLGHPLQIDLSGLEPGMKLTGMPRVPAEMVKLVRLEAATKPKDELPSIDCAVTPSPVLHASVTRVRCLTTADALKRTLHVELDVGDEFDFEPGDAFGVIAPNDETLVEALVSRLTSSTEEGYQVLYSVQGDNLPTHLQKASSVTIADLLRYAVDLTSPPRKALLRMLADFATDAKEKTTMMYLSSKQGASQFNAVRDQMPTLLDILTTFPSCQTPIERLLDALPAHMPRYYSIANSPLKYPRKIRFAFNVVDYTTSYNVPRKGVATPWLDRLTGLIPPRAADSPVTEVDLGAGSIKIPIFKKTNANAFVLPTDTSRPLVLIGPGTGIAPFIGFLEHRHEQKRIRKSMGGVGLHPSRDIEKEFGPIWVYYGFRERSKDYLFQQELEGFVKDGTVTHLRLAVSREEKVYVQDLMRADSAKLYDLIVNRDAAIYVCGDARGMAKGVHDALVEMLCQHHEPPVDPVEANKILLEWTNGRKYLRDLWA